MAGEENDDIVTYIVKIKVTLTISYPEDDRETQPTFIVDAQTLPSEGDDVAQVIDVSTEGDDRAATSEESVHDREKQDMDVGTKTVVVLSSDDEGSVEADDMAAKDLDENSAAQKGEENVSKEKKNARRKRKNIVYSSEEGEENELVSEKNWEGADVEGGFSSGCVRKRDKE